MRKFFLNLAMFILVLIMSPLGLIEYLKNYILGLSDEENQVLFKTIAGFVQPLIIVTLNAGVIPTIVDIIANLENHKTKSSRQVAIMRKNFVFQIINTILLQITLSSTIQVFLK